MRKFTVAVVVLIVLVVAALAIDEISYWSWRTRMTRVAAKFESSTVKNQNFWANELPPATGFASKPNIAFIASFQPPMLAWTYHVSMHNKAGFAFVRAYVGAKQRILSSSVNPEFRVEHSPFHIGVRRCMLYDPCAPKDAWLPYVEHQVGSF
jgi:hypothetical protein